MTNETAGAKSCMCGVPSTVAIPLVPSIVVFNQLTMLEIWSGRVNDLIKVL